MCLWNDLDYTPLIAGPVDLDRLRSMGLEQLFFDAKIWERVHVNNYCLLLCERLVVSE